MAQALRFAQERFGGGWIEIADGVNARAKGGGRGAVFVEQRWESFTDIESQERRYRSTATAGISEE